MTTDPHRGVAEIIWLNGLDLKAPVSLGAMRITRLRFHRLKGSDLRRIPNPDACRDDLIAVATRLPAVVVSEMCAEDKALALAAIKHACGPMFEVVA